MLKKILRELSSLIQSSKGSYNRHNSQYEETGKLERDRALGLENIKNNTINGPEHRTLDLWAQHPDVKTVIDIGSGAGWVSAVLSEKAENVIAIEPSAAAVSIAKTSYPLEKYSNIDWRIGFGEDVLKNIKLDKPALFVTGCVLSHLRDKETEKICGLVNEIAPIGSIFSFVECWGDTEWHQLMWHVRTKDWWRAQFPGWELNFHGPEVPELDTYKGKYNKGIWGVKKGNA